MTIKVPMGIFGASTIVTHSAFVDTEEGMIIVFQAPMSLNGWSRWSVVETENEGKVGLLLREQATLTGLRFLMPFVVGTEKKSHKEFQLNFAKCLESEVVGEAPARDAHFSTGSGAKSSEAQAD